MSQTTYLVDHFGDQTNLKEQHEYVRKALTLNPRLLLGLIGLTTVSTQSYLNRIEILLGNIESILERIKAESRGESIELYNISVRENLLFGDTLLDKVEEVNEQILELNEYVASIKYMYLNKSNLTSNSTLDSVNVTPKSNSEVVIDEGPYNISNGDVVNIFGNVARLSESQGIMYSKQLDPLTSFYGRLRIVSNLGVKNVSLENFNIASIALFLNQLDDYTVEIVNNTIRITPSSSISFFYVEQTPLAKTLGFPKRSVYHSNLYTSAQELQEQLGGVVVRKQIYSGPITTDTNTLITPSLLGRYVLVSGADYYVVDDGIILDYANITSIENIEKSECTIYSESLKLRGSSLDSPITSLTTQHFASSSEVTLDKGLKKGDLVGGVEVLELEGSVYKLSSPLGLGEYEYEMCLERESKQASSLPYLSVVRTGRESEDIISLRTSISKYRIAISGFEGNRNLYTYIDSIGLIRDRLYSLGYDRAGDLFYKGQLDTFFSLSSSDGSYESFVTSSVDGLVGSLENL